MQKSAFRSVLADRLSDFVSLKRLGGVDPGNQIELLRPFDHLLEQERFRGSWPTPVLVERYLATTKHLHPGTQANRLSVVRQFCRYLRQLEPECYIPDATFKWARRPSRLPHIFSETEIRSLLRSAGDLAPANSLRPETYVTLFGLLYATGLRCGEAFALNFAHVDLERDLLFVQEGKFGKSRWVPISPSISRVLWRYIEKRRRVAPTAPGDPLFITSTGRRLYHTNADLAYRQALKNCGLRGGKGCPGPRLHDLRHSFACRRLLEWYREGKDVNALLPALATYLGHVNVTSTQVYLRATAELLGAANERFLRNFRQHVLQKEGG